MINRLTVVVRPMSSTCWNIQLQKVYDVLAGVAFDVVSFISKAQVQELR